MSSVKTKKGTELPLLNLKGKPYLQVAQRIVWFAEEVERYTISSDVTMLGTTGEASLAKVTVTTFNAQGDVLRSVTDFKQESKKDFPDFIEKSVTGALGRCLASLGFGTAYAIADLDEGARIVDSPVVDTRSVAKPTVVASVTSSPAAVAAVETAASAPASKRPSFAQHRKNKSSEAVAKVEEDI